MTKDIIAESVQNDLRYFQLLARSFPTIADACTEIINLEAILNLPKGTEQDRKSTRLNSSHSRKSRMPSSA